MFHQQNIIPPSINIFKTNIHYSDVLVSEFWDSVGVCSEYGQFIDPYRKMFFKIQLSSRYKKKHRTDLMYIVNEEKIEKRLGYYSIEFQIMDELERNLCSPVFIFMLLNAFNELASKLCIKYKLKVNKIKLKKRKLSNLLKLRYEFEKK